MILLLPGDQENTPVPFAPNRSVSMLQIRVSVKGSVINGLSLTSIVFLKIVSRQPLLLPTINLICLKPVVLYFHEGLREIEVSFVAVSSPKSQRHLSTNPNTVRV
jgi:hypothetical protein